MRILFTVNRLHAGSGGAQRVVSLLCNGISDLGHEVLLILYEDRTDNDYYLSDEVSVSVLHKQKRKENSLFYMKDKLCELRDLVKNFQPDVIVPFLSDPTLCIYIATRFSKFSNRIITTVRNNPKIFPKERKYRWRNNILIALNKACFFQNSEQRDYFPKFIQKKSFVLPNPVSNELLETNREKSDVCKIVTLGRLSEQKNHQLLIEAVSLASQKYPEITLDIYGDGPLKSKLQEMIDKNNMAGRIHLCGITDDVKSVLLTHGLFIMTSNYEGMPNALIEAMATGMPCISTDCPTGPAELIQNMNNGILVPINDVKQCTEAIEYMLQNSQDAYLMARKAKNTIKENLTCGEISKKFVHYCKEFICGK